MNVQNDLVQYFDAARQLKRSMRRNASDFEMVRYRRTSLIYIVDANVVAMFAAPTEKKEYLNVFANWLDPELLLSTVTLTAEFLFSGQLPGQGDHPVFITPDHYEDLLAMAEGIGHKINKLSRNVLPDPDNATRERSVKISNLGTKYNEKKLSADEFLKELGAILPSAIFEILKGPIAEARQLRRLIEGNSLLRADTQDWFHSEMMSPDPNEIVAWATRIRKYEPNRSATSLLRDARSMAQLLALGRDPPDNTQYIFVTTDNAIRRAYHEYFYQERYHRHNPPPINFRRPQEFAPLLNLASMTKHTEMEALFPRIERALDDLLIGIAEHEREIRDRIQLDQDALSSRAPAYGGVLSNSELGKPSRLEERIEELRGLWSEAVKVATVVNSGYLTKREQAYFSSIQNILKEDNVVAAAHSQLQETIERLSALHLRYAFAGMRRLLESRVVRAQEVPSFRARRAPLQIREEIFKLLIKEPINSYLDLLFRHEEELPSIDALTSVKPSGLSFLFAACVAVAAEAWTYARSFAEHALKTIDASKATESSILEEARYCLAVSIRFTLRDRDDLRVALELLRSSTAYWSERKDPLGRLRAETESAALLRTFIFRASPAVMPKQQLKLEPGELDKLWNNCQSHLRAAEELLDTQGTEPSEPDARMYTRLALQIFAAEAAMAIYEHWISPRGASIREDEKEKHRETLKLLDDAIDEWDKLSDKNNSPYTTQVFSAVLGFILAKTDVDRDQARRDARVLLKNLFKFKKELLDLDLAEFELFQTKLS